MGIYSQNYDARNLDDNSIYKDFDRKDLVVEAEYLRAHLKIILEYLEKGGTDLDKIKGVVMDGIYDSRI